MIRFSLVIAFSVALKVTPAQAKDDDIDNVQKLITPCGQVLQDDLAPMAIYCLGMITGVMHTLQASCFAYQDHDYFNRMPVFAMAEGPAPGAAIQTFLNYVKANPDTWDMRASFIAAMALSEQFPCELK